MDGTQVEVRENPKGGYFLTLGDRRGRAAEVRGVWELRVLAKDGHFVKWLTTFSSLEAAVQKFERFVRMGRLMGFDSEEPGA